ncbi:MAG: hypothetical protein ACKOX6_07170 [Bdellovibrio sp.]
MPLKLRVDVDKPYGNHNFIRKVASKIVEETGITPPQIGYLDHLKTFLDEIDSANIKAIFYFRLCTLPTTQLVKRMTDAGHAIGWHTENTTDFPSFLKELNVFSTKMNGLTPHSFSKHGSGQHKLGRYHYPPYEPSRYLEWAKKINVPFLSGNSIISSSDDLLKNAIYDEYIFWVERDYRSEKYQIENLAKDAKDRNITILCHPENFVRDPSCKEDLKHIINVSKSQNIQWL